MLLYIVSFSLFAAPFLLLVHRHQAASILDSEQYITTTYAGGFPVGYQDGSKAYIFNHVNIIVEYHPLDVSASVRGFASLSLPGRWAAAYSQLEILPRMTVF